MSFRFEKLEIWKSANNYARQIYKITKNFPQTELFSLTDQIKRAANSISANIAEGSGSTSNKDFINFLNISAKSTYETVSFMYRAQQENYISEATRQELYQTAEILIKQIQAFKKSLLTK